MTILNDNLLTTDDFRRVSGLVYRHCGIHLHQGKMELVRARLAKHIRGGGFQSAADYLDHVRADASGHAFSEMINSLCTNLTCFFREPAHFAYLAGTFLPALLARRAKQGQNKILVWSAGCSTGQEAYSLAMALLSATDGQPKWDIRILATDISTRALRIARAGVYPETASETIPPADRAKHLLRDRIGDRPAVRVAPHLQRLVRFRYLNLMEPWPFTGSFDLIFCRNVMMYFDKPTQEGLVNRFWDCTRPGGLLFTGHAESLTGTSHRYRYVHPTIYTRPAPSWGRER